MAKLDHYYTKFQDERFYHVYNRTIDKQPMFKNRGNYDFFLKRFSEYLSPVVDTYAYCLLDNHFHILFRVKDLASVAGFQKGSGTDLSKSVHDIVSHQFRKFFQSYALAFNKQHGRLGTLFQTPFKRSFVSDQSYITQLVYYIHANPQKHRLINDFRKWEWSSYLKILTPNKTKLMKQEVLDWFGGADRYKEYHQEKHQSLNEQFGMYDD